MRSALLVLCVLGLTSCTAFLGPPPGSEFYGRGYWSASGQPEGEWKLFARANDSLAAEGVYSDGLPEGMWTLHDTGGTKVAEVSFHRGVLDGEYRFFYTSFTAEASGKRKTIGRMATGAPSGRFTRYDPDGTLLVEYSAENGVVTSVHQGSRESAEHQLALDIDYLEMIVTIILNTPLEERANAPA